MYGVINAIEGLDAFNDLMKNTNIGPWYTRMKKQVNSHAGATQQDWLVREVEAWLSNEKKKPVSGKCNHGKVIRVVQSKF